MEMNLTFENVYDIYINHSAENTFVWLECVSKMRDVQFRVDWAAFQGDFPQACWRPVKGNQRTNAGKGAVTATKFPAKCTSGILETHSIGRDSAGRYSHRVRREKGRADQGEAQTGRCEIYFIDCVKRRMELCGTVKPQTDGTG